MQFWPVKLIQPIAVLCMSLLLILLLLPDSSLVLGGKGRGGKKQMTPVKHLFGIGIGYQRVVHYKPVLVFSNHRRPKKKKRPPGWGWGGWGGGGAHNKKGWSPVVVQHHIYKDPHHQTGRGGGGGGGGDHQQHHPISHAPPKSRPPPMKSYSPPPSRSRHRNSYRGWGWRPARRNPPSVKSHRSHHPSRHRQEHHEHDEGCDHKSHSNGGGGSRRPHYSPSPNDDEYSAGGGEDKWRPGFQSYGTPNVDYIDGDSGGYKTEVKEQWNKHSNRPLTPLVFPGTTVSSSPPLTPFAVPPKSDTSVTNIGRDFLKTHLKNFKEFQGYQSAHSDNENENDDNPQRNHVHNPMMMKPPGPSYATMSAEGSPTDMQYYDDYPQNGRSDLPSSSPTDYNYDVVDDDGFNWSELNRKMAVASTTPSPNTVQVPPAQVQQSPSIVYGVQGALPSNQHNVVMNAPVQTNIQVGGGEATSMPNGGGNNGFKPSQRIDEMGSGSAFSDPGFFPSFDQFHNIRME